jgi:type IV pilus assembly protein PilE
MIDPAMNKPYSRNTVRAAGFTLIELLIAIAIVGVLTAIAVPSYQNHVRRGYIQEATSGLSSGRIAMEQYFLDNRTFVGAPCPANTDRFAITCTLAAATYTLTATGSGSVSGFVYTINERNVRATTGPWGAGACWIDRKGDTC